MATDTFAGIPPGLMDQPATQAFDAFAAKSDSVDLTIATRGIYTGSGGTMKVTMLGGTAVTFVSVPAGSLLPLRISRLWSTGLTATDVLGLY